MPTPRPIIAPRIGATVPIVMCDATTISVMEETPTASSATPIGSTAARSVPKRKSRMTTAATIPIRSAASELCEFWMSTTVPPYSTSIPAARAGAPADSSASKAPLGRSANEPS